MTSRNSSGWCETPARRSTQRGGFTLIEMIVVLVIVGLVFSLIVARGPMRSRNLETRAAARDVSQSLRAARAAAIAGNHPVVFTLDPARHIFGAIGGQVGQLPQWLDIAPIVTQNLPHQSGVIAIRFSPDGSSSGGSIELNDRRLRISIDVDWLTGRIRVDDGR